MHFELWQWALGALGAFLVGLSKTGIPGLGILSVAFFALIFPPRESTGIVLVILMVGDIFAIASYRRNASWTHLARLFPWAVAGVVLGYFALGRVDDTQMRHLIGVIVVALVVFQFVRSRQAAPADDEAQLPRRWVAPLAGITAGFTTMVANAAGPIMVLYFLAMRLPKLVFVGTGAWYFFTLNIFKTPFSASLGLINLSSLWVDLWLAPFCIAGALIGRPLLERINQKVFELVALALTLLAGLAMLR